MTGAYFFEDNNLDVFCVFDWKQTTLSWGKNLEDTMYENQDHILPEFRIKKYLEPEEFWSSDEPREFRVAHSKYAERKRFVTWLRKELESEESFNEILDKKFGKVELYEDPDNLQPQVERKPAVYEYNQQYILGPNSQPYITFPDIYPPKAISKDDPEAEMFDPKFYVKQKALRELQRSES